MRERGIILTEGLVLGLFFVQRYRFLTIDQFARAAGMHRDTASRQLRNLELRGVLSHFGNACLPGHGRTPKVYFLTRKGFELLSRRATFRVSFWAATRRSRSIPAGRRRCTTGSEPST